MPPSSPVFLVPGAVARLSNDGDGDVPSRSLISFEPRARHAMAEYAKSSRDSVRVLAAPPRAGMPMPPPGTFSGGFAGGGAGGGNGAFVGGPGGPGSGPGDDEGGAPPNKACRLLFGASVKTAPIDAGFPTHTPFDHGELDVRPGTSEITAEFLEEQQRPLSAADHIAGAAIIGMAASTGVGLFYLVDKCTLVKQGEVAIVQSYDGRTRALGRGLYLSATVGTSVRKFALSDNVIRHANILIIRVLPARTLDRAHHPTLPTHHPSDPSPWPPAYIASRAQPSPDTPAQGHVGLCTSNGKPVLLLAGQHLINDPLFAYVGDRELTDTQIQIGTTHIITVPSDQVGLAAVASVAHFLGPGRHAFNNASFSFFGFKDATDPHISLHSKHRIYVPRGRLALVMLDVEPLMLEPGLHNFDAPRFLFKEMALATAPYLFVGSMHRLFVPAGAIAQVIDGGVGQLLETPGVHIFNSATFEFKGCVAATTPFVRVGAASRVVVAAGTLGKLTINGAAQLLPPGVHVFTESNLTFDGAAPATDVLIEYGNIKRVLVPQGTWYITYDDGALVCLPPGNHTLTKSSHRVAGALSAGMTVLALKGVRSMTADNVQLLFDAALSVRVVDPIKAVTMLCGGAFSWDSLTATILRKADLSLNSSIGQHRFNQTQAAISTTLPPQQTVFESDKLLDHPGASSLALTTAGGSGGGGGGGRSRATNAALAGGSDGGGALAVRGEEDPRPEPASFKEQIHRAFMSEFCEMMRMEAGTEIISMTIEGVSIVDPDLAKEMAKGAVARAQLVAATVSNEAMQKAAVAKASAVKIEAEGEAASMQIRAQADANAKLVNADADARAVLLTADAESKRIAQVSTAMANASPAMIQRELLTASGTILSAMDTNGSRVFVGPDPIASVMAMMTGAMGSMGSLGGAAGGAARSR